MPWCSTSEIVIFKAQTKGKNQFSGCAAMSKFSKDKNAENEF